jgi:crotonobetainyl-CoA:carnitine CoA-transferase CaiB-like acyl-CoA transferase
VVENGYVITQDHPKHGTMRTLGVMVNLSQTPGRVGGPAPEVGQHTEEVLTGLAGYSPEEVRDLVQVGIAGCA